MTLNRARMNVCVLLRGEDAVERFGEYRTVRSQQKPNGRMYQSLGDMGNKKKFLLCSKKSSSKLLVSIGQVR